MGSPVLKAHLLRALTRTTLKLATSPIKSPPKIRLDPETTSEDQEVKDVFESFVTNVYTEVSAIKCFINEKFQYPLMYYTVVFSLPNVQRHFEMLRYGTDVRSDRY